MFDIVIVGGGASGMMSALSAKDYNSNLSVAIVEKNDRVGKKILSTGNGRCNLTNTDINIDRYHGNNVSFAIGALNKFNYDATIDYFTSLGIFPKTEGNKVFPYSLQASSVVDVLRMNLKKYCIDEICNFECTKIEQLTNSFKLYSKSGNTVTCKKLIMSFGGAAGPKFGTDGTSYALLKRFGHKLSDTYPGLVQVKTNPKKVIPMKGVKVDCNVSAYVNNQFVKSEFGELLFTEYGLSGPCIFQLSRIASVQTSKGNNVDFYVDIMPELTVEEVYYHLCARNRFVPVEEFLTGMINKLCARQLLKICGVEKFNTTSEILTDDMLKKLAETIKSWKFEIIGTNSWQNAQVTVGGIDTSDFNPSTMESKLIKGLYACGELLDIDGDCGGFNLQWAWSSGYIAGQECAKQLG